MKNRRIFLVRYEVADGKTGVNNFEGIHYAVHSVWADQETADTFLVAVQKKYPEETYSMCSIQVQTAGNLDENLKTLV